MFGSIMLTIILTFALGSVFFMLTVFNSAVIEEWSDSQIKVLIYFILMGLPFAIWIVWF